jgi:hypothetical protein
MTLTLDPLLKEVQDGQSHRPVIEIRQIFDDYEPFDGMPFDGESVAAGMNIGKKISAIVHSSKRICALFLHNDTTLKYSYSDVDRTSGSWTTVSYSMADLGVPGCTLMGAALCELADGTIGIIYISEDPIDDHSYFRVRQAIIDLAGNISSTALIEQIVKYHIGEHPDGIHGDVRMPAVIKQRYGNYILMIFIEQNVDEPVIWEYTSLDFSSWSARFEIPTGLAIGIMETISLALMDSNQLILCFDYWNTVNTANCYTMISGDGITWTDRQKMTNYTDGTAEGVFPAVIQKKDYMILQYTERKYPKYLNADSAGWPLKEQDVIVDITIDDARGKAYLTNGRTTAGYKAAFSIIEIDLATQAVTRYWDNTIRVGYPRFNDIYFTYHIWWLSNQGEGNYVPMSTVSIPGVRFIAILNTVSNTIEELNFDDNAQFSIVKNAAWTEWAQPPTRDRWKLHGTIICDNFLYYYMSTAYPGRTSLEIGRMNISLPGGAGGNINSLVRNQTNAREIDSAGFTNGQIVVLPSREWIIVSAYQTVTTHIEGWYGTLSIFGYGEGTESVYRAYAGDGSFEQITHPTGAMQYVLSPLQGLPYRGLRRFIAIDHTEDDYMDDDQESLVIYGIFARNGDRDEANVKGLVKITISGAADIIVTYHYPSWSPPLEFDQNEYQFFDLVLTDDYKIFITGMYGTTIFDIATEEWALLERDNVTNFSQGWTQAGEPATNACGVIQYSPLTNNFCIARRPDITKHPPGSHGVMFFKPAQIYMKSGYLDRSYFKTAELITRRNQNEQSVPLIDPDDGTILHTLWHAVGDNRLLQWDRESYNLAGFIKLGSSITITRTIEERPATLSFDIGQGWLFDPYNTTSLYQNVLDKGKRLRVWIGERINGLDFLAQQGTYLVDEIGLSYALSKLPEMRVSCKDFVSLWDEIDIIATKDFDGDYPETTIKNILVNYLGLQEEHTVSDLKAHSAVASHSYPGFDIDDFVNRSVLYQQWLNNPAMDIITDVGHRHGYAVILGVDNVVTCRRIHTSNPVNHVYGTLNQILSFTPNTTYSDNVNRVTVEGETRDFVQITYPREAVITKGGTIGWWQGNEVIKCYYSEDHSRVCLDPYPTWITHMTSMGKWGTRTFTMIEHDDNKGVDLIISGLNLTSQFWGVVEAFALYQLLSRVLPDLIVGVGAGWTVPIGRIAEWVINQAFYIILFDVLMSITNWQVEIKATPIGQERKTIEAAANDIAHQTAIGKIVEERIDDPLAFTESDCLMIAAHEQLIHMLERKRVSFSKISHLQDTEGDVLKVAHPYTGTNLDVLATKITRTIKIPERSGEQANFSDDIEGWIISNGGAIS